ncbi:MAG: hypothetical protein OEU74_05215 [Gammaproteobacteria bacterium]|nr:hypothetical protein [Gammaproteobacteria bacterium]
MLNKQLATSCFAIALATCALSTKADVLVNDDLIVQGSQCVGFDCINGEIFDGDILRLKENNLRIRFHDTSAPDGLGQSWSLSANNTINGGKSYLSFELKSLTKDNLQLSDGAAPLYDCSVGVSTTFELPPIIGVIPFGEPVTFPENPVLDQGSGNYFYECNTRPDFTVKPIMLLRSMTDNDVTLGFDSQPEDGAISVGATGLLRNLKHVVAGIADTDLLITQALNSYMPFQDQETQLAALQQQVTDLETQIIQIEDRVFNNQAPTAPILVSPSDNETVSSSPVTLTWRRSTDGDGDAIHYSVTVCEQMDFTGCAPVDVASIDQSTAFAGLGSGAGMLLLFGVVMPHMRNRRQRWLHRACAISTVVAVTVSSGCFHNNNNNNDISYVASGLNSGATYFWKVTATDFIDASDSEVRSFNIQ